MAEPKDKTATEKKTVADDDLAAAWAHVDDKAEDLPTSVLEEKQEAEAKKDGGKEPDKAAAAETPEKSQADIQSTSAKSPDPLQEHKDNSRLGRQVKGLKDKLAALEARIAQKPETMPEELPEIVTTPQDVERIVEARDKKRIEDTQRSRDIYQRDYIMQLNSLEPKDTAQKEFHNEIIALMTEKDSPFNVQWGSNGFADARINYAESKASLIEKKHMPMSDLPHRATASASPVTPAASASSAASKVLTLPKLDADAQRYVDYLKREGKTDTEIAEMLK